MLNVPGQCHGLVNTSDVNTHGDCSDTWTAWSALCVRPRGRGYGAAMAAVDVAGVQISKPDKVLFPGDGAGGDLSKRDLAEYYPPSPR